jgi:glycyl-tRNA synthetase
VTIDGDTLEAGTVTIRDRDSMEQVRVHEDELVGWMHQQIANWTRD